MKNISYYKKLKSQKDQLKANGWVESACNEGKRSWTHPDIEGNHSVNGAFKLINISPSLDKDEVKTLKDTINHVIDVVLNQTAEINEIKKVVKGLQADV